MTRNGGNMGKEVATSRPCSIREDGHGAVATHNVSSDAYGFVLGRPRSRNFCSGCAAEEVALLEEFGFSAEVDVIVHPRRVFAPVPPQPTIIAWAGDDPIWHTP